MIKSFEALPAKVWPAFDAIPMMVPADVGICLICVKIIMCSRFYTTFYEMRDILNCYTPTNE